MRRKPTARTNESNMTVFSPAAIVVKVKVTGSNCRMLTAMVTVGATAPFDALLDAVLSVDVLRALKDKGFSRLVVQAGDSRLPLFDPMGMDVAVWNFKPSLNEDILKADLIISHAGSGTIVDVLRLGKPLIVVPNPLLLHNHQQELATALDNRQHLKAASIKELPLIISNFELSNLRPFPAFDATKFQKLLDDEMGFI